MPFALRLLLPVLMLAGFIPAHAASLVDIDSLKSRMSSRPLLPLEGIWELTADGAVIAIERIENHRRGHTSAYRLTALSMPDRSISPGAEMGTAYDTADAHKFDAKIYTKSSADGSLTSPADFVLSLDNDNTRMSMSHYRRGLRVNLWRMVPYMFRYSVHRRDERPRGLDGMIKIYPRPASGAATPRYL